MRASQSGGLQGEAVRPYLRGAANHVYGDAGIIQGVQDPQVGQPPGPSTAEDQTHSFASHPPRQPGQILPTAPYSHDMVPKLCLMVPNTCQLAKSSPAAVYED